MPRPDISSSLGVPDTIWRTGWTTLPPAPDAARPRSVGSRPPRAPCPSHRFRSRPPAHRSRGLPRASAPRANGCGPAWPWPHPNIPSRRCRAGRRVEDLDRPARVLRSSRATNASPGDIIPSAALRPTLPMGKAGKGHGRPIGIGGVAGKTRDPHDLFDIAIEGCQIVVGKRANPARPRPACGPGNRMAMNRTQCAP